MTQIWTNILEGVSAFLAGVALRLSAVWLGNLPILAMLVLTLSIFGWIFAKTRFSRARYTPGLWRVQMAMIWAVLGFNLATFLEG
ncbi:hypothetical protein [uncultured Marivita sp.]|uniref:hypothetical protein n=1 Tax=uncultured Marivita sp. TaxID=888080 RepID=UPI00262B0054|nr:hypothetical protein [uncultured Marivita sp.]